MASLDPTLASLEQIKARLRASMRERRAEAHHHDQQLPVHQRAAARAIEHFFERAGLERHSQVAAYWPMQDEFDPRPLMNALHQRGHVVALPVTHGAGQPLSFRRWHPDLSLIPGAYRIPTPPPDAEAVNPSILLIPLLACDSQGYRLGYGGGYYDRTLALLRNRTPWLDAIGLTYEAQILPQVPHDHHDARLDGLLSEARFRRMARPGA